ncbi:MAG: ImmA/IrrE family metallo-endopeptidase [Gemmatimonadetes bacterium]|nr:ImmA/IrrE family metallo-endopeptidase [Gemmatimonadota bacterium]
MATSRKLHETVVNRIMWRPVLMTSTSRPTKGPAVLDVNPAILSWARETAGLSAEGAVKKLGLKDARGVAAIDRLTALENGEVPPTRAMLSKMAKQYRRPLLTFYLAQPPRRGDWGKDFRAPMADRSREDEAVLNALVRNVQARQGLLREAMLDDDENLPALSFVASVTTDTPVTQVVASIRDTLGLQLEDYRAARSPDGAFRLLRSHAEQAGIFVLMVGNLGSHHTDLGVEVFRGFALADDFAPFVVVNPKDSSAARCFTLVHELAHLWIGEPGISGGDPMDPVEVFCNKVASSYLLPDDELGRFRGPATNDLDAWMEAVATFAAPLNISYSMVVYRLHRQGVIAHNTWLALSQLFRRGWLDSRSARRKKQRARDGGPSYGVLVRHSLGPGLLELAAQLVSSGSLTATKAGRVMGVNPRNAHAILEVP